MIGFIFNRYPCILQVSQKLSLQLTQYLFTGFPLYSPNILKNLFPYFLPELYKDLLSTKPSKIESKIAV
jgi:hypothetical protein